MDNDNWLGSVKFSPGKMTKDPVIQNPILQLWSTDGSHSDLGELRRRRRRPDLPQRRAPGDANDALRTSSKFFHKQMVKHHDIRTLSLHVHQHRIRSRYIRNGKLFLQSHQPSLITKIFLLTVSIGQRNYQHKRHCEARQNKAPMAQALEMRNVVDA